MFLRPIPNTPSGRRVVAAVLAGSLLLFSLGVASGADDRRLAGRRGSDSASGPHKAAGRLRVEGRRFVSADGSPFDWRGLTSFRLVEMVARDGRAEAAAVLDWAAAQGVTVVRVLAMAHNLFKLSPEEGRRALPPLLELARARGLQVEVVALADTRLVDVDVRSQVKAIGAICAGHSNCLLEIANEPWHPAHQDALGQPGTLRQLRDLVPASVLVAYGSHRDDDSDAYAGGDYIVVHVGRDEAHAGWGHVLRIGGVQRLAERVRKPVVDDEPIGAGPKAEPGRRDADPSRWLAKGALARLFGLGATFHYEGGLASRLPSRVEAECFRAWKRGLDTLPAGLAAARVAEAASPGGPVASVNPGAALAVYVAEQGTEAWAVGVGVTGDLGLRWGAAWHADPVRGEGAVLIQRARRR